MKHNYAQRLVGHRGLMISHPENTLVGYQAAIAAGARWIECDLQLTKDQQVVVLHDDQLARTANLPGAIFDYTLAQAQTFSVHEEDKFADRYQPEYIPSLAQFLQLLAAHPQVTAMIEIKQESIDQFDLTTFVDAVFPQVQALGEQVIIISFNAEVVAAAKKANLRCGWVIETLDPASHEIANTLLPEFLITDVLLLDLACLMLNQPLSQQLWSAPAGHQWQWMLYDVLDPQLAKTLMDQGVDLIETADIAGLIKQFE